MNIQYMQHDAKIVRF